MTKKLAFLGGTVGNNDWRKGFIARLTAAGVPSDNLFDPVVADWNAEAQEREEATQSKKTFFLFAAKMAEAQVRVEVGVTL